MIGLRTPVFRGKVILTFAKVHGGEAQPSESV